MKTSTQNTVEGQLHETKGTIKETVGHVLNKPDVEAEGQAEKVEGTIQKKVADFQKALGK